MSIFQIKKQDLLLIIFSILIGLGLGLFITSKQPPVFENLSVKEMYEEIIAKRDIAIQKAVEEGDFKCCINPPCTMCFMEANQWNNFQPATCACDDLIAQGKEPCPQCVRGLCDKTEEGTCQVNSE